MARHSWVQDPRTGKLIPKDEWINPPQAGFYVVGDINPYKSMITGEMIQGRAHHRAHLRQHGCIEVGNEMDKRPQKAFVPPPGLKQQLIDVVNSKL